MVIKGKVRVGRKTKDLVKRLEPYEIALIKHKDLDETAAQSLVEAKVIAVINADTSISGRFPNKGPLLLIKAGIPLIDNIDEKIIDSVVDGQNIIIDDGYIILSPIKQFKGKVLRQSDIISEMESAKQNFIGEFARFIENTMDFAKKEMDLFLGSSAVPPLDMVFNGRHVLIVARGQNYKQDLWTIRGYIKEIRPIIIGVDGGSDALLENGFKPDIIIGDMDSVSDKALKCGARLIVHAYPSGYAPGLQRLEALKLNSLVFPASGTSEDIAMLLAYEKGAELIVLVGAHSNVLDFLEKGRAGMSSTFLVRLKVGSILVDAKGVSKLYRTTVSYRHLGEIFLAALLLFLIVFTVSPATFQFFRLALIRMQMLLNL
ncbi:MAG: hypothetical protein KGZ75_09610 [Syntrophomonadaceae bacterium]|nr:hypothetical protein [Syntrophomonadaceae bacterium]